ncbi:MAG: phosphopantetheine adenylyltransferase [Planctomycetota bacterium]
MRRSCRRRRWACAGCAGRGGAPRPYHGPVARHLAIYTGSFDPITYGHLDILRRARGMFDEIVLAIGRNPNKEALFTFEEREAHAKALVAEILAKEPSGAHIRVDHYAGLTVDFARSVGACAIIRGIRNITDLAGECQLAITNRQVAGIETIFIVTGENFAYTSSSLIKQIAALGGSLDALATLVPPAVVEALAAKRGDRGNPIGRLARDGLAE